MPEAHTGASGLKYARVALLLLGASASPCGAQSRPVNDNTLSITVVSTSGAPLSFSTVAVLEAGVERFSNQRGELFLSGLAPGTYHIRVRQLGYLAYDTVVELNAAQKNLQLHVRLIPIPFLLENVVVTAVGKCPRATDLTEPENAPLALIFGEVSKNADRLRLLRERYPFTYTLWREFSTFDRFLGPRNVQRDTVMYASTPRWLYSPGEVVQHDSATAGGQQVMRLPQLVDLADTTFQSTHCFYYRGTEKKDGGTQHRIDFIPLSTFDFPDVAGSVFIDTRSYVLTSALFRLTNGDKLNPPVPAIQVTTTFREIFPNVVIFSEINATQPVVTSDSRPSLAGRQYTELRQKQRLINYQFLRGGPGDTITMVRADTVVRANTALNSIDATFGTVTGTVVSRTGAPISGALISTEDPNLSAVTDVRGHFAIRALLQGDQQLIISADGFETARIQVVVVAGKAIALPLVLYPKNQAK